MIVNHQTRTDVEENGRFEDFPRVHHPERECPNRDDVSGINPC